MLYVSGFVLQRRRSAEDEQMMRKYLVEGDLISAEVQSIFADGSLSLHTRSFTYGKVCVPDTCLGFGAFLG